MCKKHAEKFEDILGTSDNMDSGSSVLFRREPQQESKPRTETARTPDGTSDTTDVVRRLATAAAASLWTIHFT